MPFLEPLERLAARGVPQAGRAIAAGRDDFFAVARVAGREHRIFMAGKHRRVQHANFLIALNVPQAHALIVATGEHPLAVGRERTCPNRAAVAAERRQNFAGRDVPDADRVVLAAAEHELTVRREANRAHWPVVAGQANVIRFRIGLVLQSLAMSIGRTSSGFQTITSLS